MLRSLTLMRPYFAALRVKGEWGKVKEEGGKPAARASQGNVKVDNFKNVANVEMLPVSMLPIANEN